MESIPLERMDQQHLLSSGCPTPVTPSSRTPPTASSQPPFLTKKPLVVIGCLSMIFNSLSFGCSFRYGCEVASAAENIALSGNIIMILMSVAYLFYTMKLIFCILSSTFPSWPDIKELRDSVMRMTVLSALGTAFYVASLSAYTEYGYVEKPPMSIKEADLEFDITPYSNSNQTTDNHNYLEYIDGSIVIENIPSENIDVNNNSSLDNITTSEKKRSLSKSELTAESANTIVDLNKSPNSDLSEKETVLDGDENSSENKNAEPKKGENIPSSGDIPSPKILPFYEANVPIVSLFVCSFSFCLPISIVVLGILFISDAIKCLKESEATEPPVNPHPVNIPPPCLRCGRVRSIPSWVSSNTYCEVYNPCPVAAPPPAPPLNTLPPLNIREPIDNLPGPSGEDTVCHSRATYVTCLSPCSEEPENDENDGDFPQPYAYTRVQARRCGTSHSLSSSNTDSSHHNGHLPGYPMYPCHNIHYHYPPTNRGGKFYVGQTPRHSRDSQESASSNRTPNTDLLHSGEASRENAAASTNLDVSESEGAISLPSSNLATAGGGRTPATQTSSTDMSVPVIQSTDTDQLLETARNDLASVILHSVDTGPEEAEEIEKSSK